MLMRSLGLAVVAVAAVSFAGCTTCDCIDPIACIGSDTPEGKCSTSFQRCTGCESVRKPLGVMGRCVDKRNPSLPCGGGGYCDACKACVEVLYTAKNDCASYDYLECAQVSCEYSYEWN